MEITEDKGKLPHLLLFRHVDCYYKSRYITTSIYYQIMCINNGIEDIFGLQNYNIVKIIYECCAHIYRQNTQNSKMQGYLDFRMQGVQGED